MELAPALGLAVIVTGALCAAQLRPTGTQMLLVRADDEGSAVAAASASGAALVGVPAPGYAVLYGDAARVRQAAGLAVPWRRGALGCAGAS